MATEKPRPLVGYRETQETKKDTPVDPKKFQEELSKVQESEASQQQGKRQLKKSETGEEDEELPVQAPPPPSGLFSLFMDSGKSDSLLVPKTPQNVRQTQVASSSSTFQIEEMPPDASSGAEAPSLPGTELPSPPSDAQAPAPPPAATPTPTATPQPPATPQASGTQTPPTPSPATPTAAPTPIAEPTLMAQPTQTSQQPPGKSPLDPSLSDKTPSAKITAPPLSKEATPSLKEESKEKKSPMQEPVTLSRDDSLKEPPKQPFVPSPERITKKQVQDTSLLAGKQPSTTQILKQKKDKALELHLASSEKKGEEKQEPTPSPEKTPPQPTTQRDNLQKEKPSLPSEPKPPSSPVKPQAAQKPATKLPSTTPERPPLEKPMTAPPLQKPQETPPSLPAAAAAAAQASPQERQPFKPSITPKVDVTPAPIANAPASASQKDSSSDHSKKEHHDQADNAAAVQPATPPPPLFTPPPTETLPAYASLPSEVYELFERMVGTITIEQGKNSTTTTVTLDMKGSIFDGSQIILDRQSTAMNTFNIQIATNPQAQELINSNLEALVAAFQGSKLSFDVNIRKPILSEEYRDFKRKPAPGEDSQQNKKQN